MNCFGPSVGTHAGFDTLRLRVQLYLKGNAECPKKPSKEGFFV